MKISFDLDDTLNKYPATLTDLASHLKAWGHQVGILSGRSPEDLNNIFQNAGFDFIIGCPMGAPYTSDEQKAREWKSQMVREHNIDIHFDNHAQFINEGDVGNCKVVNVI